MDASKRPALLALIRVLEEAHCPYAVIGGIAVQVHRAEPRTTLDIDVVVADLAALPRAALQAAGFTHGGDFAHSQNWTGPNETPVQFTDDAPLREAIGRAIRVPVEDTELRVIRADDLLHEKLRAGSDPARRRSKRYQDLADAIGLIEDHPALEAELTDAERRRLADL